MHCCCFIGCCFVAATQVLVISQCNVMLPDAVRKMPKLERLVSVWQQLLQLTDCLGCTVGLPGAATGRCAKVSFALWPACACSGLPQESPALPAGCRAPQVPLATAPL